MHMIFNKIHQTGCNGEQKSFLHTLHLVNFWAYPPGLPIPAICESAGLIKECAILQIRTPMLALASLAAQT